MLKERTMNQEFSQRRRMDLTNDEVLATGVTLGEHNRQLYYQALNRTLAAVILVMVFLSVILGITIFVIG
jgi:hypothetical protein